MDVKRRYTVKVKQRGGMVRVNAALNMGQQLRSNVNSQLAFLSKLNAVRGKTVAITLKNQSKQNQFEIQRQKNQLASDVNALEAKSQESVRNRIQNQIVQEASKRLTEKGILNMQEQLSLAKLAKEGISLQTNRAISKEEVPGQLAQQAQRVQSEMAKLEKDALDAMKSRTTAIAESMLEKSVAERDALIQQRQNESEALIKAFNIAIFTQVGTENGVTIAAINQNIVQLNTNIEQSSTFGIVSANFDTSVANVNSILNGIFTELDANNINQRTLESQKADLYPQIVAITVKVNGLKAALGAINLAGVSSDSSTESGKLAGLKATADALKAEIARLRSTLGSIPFNSSSSLAQQLLTQQRVVGAAIAMLKGKLSDLQSAFSGAITSTANQDLTAANAAQAAAIASSNANLNSNISALGTKLGSSKSDLDDAVKQRNDVVGPVFTAAGTDVSTTETDLNNAINTPVTGLSALEQAERDFSNNQLAPALTNLNNADGAVSDVNTDITSLENNIVIPEFPIAPGDPNGIVAAEAVIHDYPTLNEDSIGRVTVAGSGIEAASGLEVSSGEQVGPALAAVNSSGPPTDTTIPFKKAVGDILFRMDGRLVTVGKNLNLQQAFLQGNLNNIGQKVLNGLYAFYQASNFSARMTMAKNVQKYSSRTNQSAINVVNIINGIKENIGDLNTKLSNLNITAKPRIKNVIDLFIANKNLKDTKSSADFLYPTFIELQASLPTYSASEASAAANLKAANNIMSIINGLIIKLTIARDKATDTVGRVNTNLLFQNDIISINIFSGKETFDTDMGISQSQRIEQQIIKEGAGKDSKAAKNSAIRVINSMNNAATGMNMNQLLNLMKGQGAKLVADMAILNAAMIKSGAAVPIAFAALNGALNQITGLSLRATGLQRQLYSEIELAQELGVAIQERNSIVREKEAAIRAKLMYAEVQQRNSKLRLEQNGLSSSLIPAVVVDTRKIESDVTGLDGALVLQGALQAPRTPGESNTIAYRSFLLNGIEKRISDMGISASGLELEASLLSPILNTLSPGSMSNIRTLQEILDSVRNDMDVYGNARGNFLSLEQKLFILLNLYIQYHIAQGNRNIQLAIAEGLKAYFQALEQQMHTKSQTENGNAATARNKIETDDTIEIEIFTIGTLQGNINSEMDARTRLEKNIDAILSQIFGLNTNMNRDMFYAFNNNLAGMSQKLIDMKTLSRLLEQLESSLNMYLSQVLAMNLDPSLRNRLYERLKILFSNMNQSNKNLSNKQQDLKQLNNQKTDLNLNIQNMINMRQNIQNRPNIGFLPSWAPLAIPLVVAPFILGPTFFNPARAKGTPVPVDPANNDCEKGTKKGGFDGDAAGWEAGLAVGKLQYMSLPSVPLPNDATGATGTSGETGSGEYVYDYVAGTEGPDTSAAIQYDIKGLNGPNENPMQGGDGENSNVNASTADDSTTVNSANATESTGSEGPVEAEKPQQQYTPRIGMANDPTILDASKIVVPLQPGSALYNKCYKEAYISAYIDAWNRAVDALRDRSGFILSGEQLTQYAEENNEGETTTIAGRVDEIVEPTPYTGEPVEEDEEIVEPNPSDVE